MSTATKRIYPANDVGVKPPPDHRREYLIAELRAAALRHRLAAADIDAMGVAVKGGLLSPEEALDELRAVDGLRYVGAPHLAGEAAQ